MAHDEGVVVVIDTELSPDLLVEGDLRELQRALQDLRREAELELDARIEAWLEPFPTSLAGGSADGSADRLDRLRADTLADRIEPGPAPEGLATAQVELSGGPVRLALRPRAKGR